jgi:SAM-dependent methyltransferase
MPILSLSQAPSKDWITEHRRVWQRKPTLRAVYRRWFQRLREACSAQTPVVELGCGPGFFKEMYPEIISTDVASNPYADRIIDATTLSFADAEVGNIVMLDVFHHLPEPESFVREVARVLQPGGRLVMLEPWMGFAGRLLFRYVHHEDCDLSVRPDAPWATAGKDPMQGNAALPYLFFRSGGYFERLDLPLRIVKREYSAGLAWVLSGGFQSLCLLPASLLGLAEAVDRFISMLPSWGATRCLIVVERQAERRRQPCPT